MSTMLPNHHGDVSSRRLDSKMTVVAVFSQKGGSGKSTVSIHLAVVAARGQKVLLVDADPQETVATWGASRSTSDPMVVRADPVSIKEVLAAAKEEGYRWVFVDCPPHAVAGTANLLRHADHIVTPVQPTMPDIASTQRTVSLASAAGKPLSFVINRAPPRSAEVLQAQQLLAAAGPVAPITLGDRRAFSRALADGLAVSESRHEDDKALMEIVRLWLWLDGHFLEVEYGKSK